MTPRKKPLENSMIKEVIYPKFLLNGIRPLKRDYPLSRNLRLFGADTETFHGLPISLQIEGPEDALFRYTDKEQIFSDFWRWIRVRCRPKGVNICYFHNLSFDLRVLFCKYQLMMYEQNNDIRITIKEPGMEVLCRILFGKVFKADLSEGGIRLQILDSKLFTQAGLARSLKMFGIPQDKFQSPEGLGRIDYRTLPPGDPLRIIFEDYSRQDAHAERALGLKIMDFHEKYQVAPSLSLPSYAARVFRRHFLGGLSDSIPFPPIEVVKASEKSYHGGKNGFYLDAPQRIEDAYEVDINSAYPYAMRELPGITKGHYCRVDGFKKGYQAVYCLSGTTNLKAGGNAKYPLVFDHSFNPVNGAFQELWHTGHEVERMSTVSHAIKLDPLWGYAWVPGEGAYNPFSRFVDHFYSKKESTPKTDPNYHFYKIVLNALYGKLGSTIEVKSAEAEDELKKLRELGVDIPTSVRIDAKFDRVLGRMVHLVKSWRAGSMYNPFLASMVTGHARGYLYDLETKLQSLHSATDSVKTRMPVSAIKGLGGVKVECFGRCYLFRNKLYLHFSRGPEYCGHQSPPFKYPAKYLDGTPHPKAGMPLVDHDGQHLCKVGLHGYKGPLWFLFENRYSLIESGKLFYRYEHVVGLREGLRKNLVPCNFIEVEETLKLGGFAEPDDLLQFIIKRGGFDYLREFESRGELDRLSLKESGKRGLVNKKGGGQPIDRLHQAAVEYGYMPEVSSLSDFFEAIENNLRGIQRFGADKGYDASDILFPDELDEEIRI